MHQRRMIKFDVRSNNVNEIIFWELIFLTTDDERDVEYVNAQYWANKKKKKKDGKASSERDDSL